jgi:hypothetical protein
LDYIHDRRREFFHLACEHDLEGIVGSGHTQAVSERVVPRVMDLKDLKSSERLISVLGDCTSEILQLVHERRDMSEDDQLVHEALQEVHEPIAGTGYTSSGGRTIRNIWLE